MISNLNSFDDHHPFECDICIVGAGPAGITIAMELLRSRLRVIVLESGTEHFDAATQELYGGRDVERTTGMDVGRLRMLGGTSNHWAGRCSALDPIDFERRGWVANSGWPIRFEAMEPYYNRAIRICGFGGDWRTDSDILKVVTADPRRFAQYAVEPKFWRHTPRRPNQASGYNFGTEYKPALSSADNVLVLLNANLMNIKTDGAGRAVQHISVGSLEGKRVSIKASRFVLATGGIENARILLHGDEGRPLGNSHDLVGRYFMEHPRVRLATLIPYDKFSDIQDTFTWDAIRRKAKLYPNSGALQVGLKLKRGAMEKNALLNASIDFYYQLELEQYSAGVSEMMSDIRRGKWVAGTGDFARLVKFAPELVARAGSGRHGIQSVALVADLEQAPDPNSRIMLGMTRDNMGMRRTVVRWSVSEQERRTALFAAQYVGAALTGMGYGRVRLAEWLVDPERDLADHLSPTFHFSGTTRMSVSPSSGVVDANCQVHGIENLYVAGSSVFPTSGYSNPTFTIVALACRLSDHLKALGALV